MQEMGHKMLDHISRQYTNMVLLHSLCEKKKE